MSDLSEFLLARIAEDEAGCRIALAVVPDHEWAGFVLAECAAKRAVIQIQPSDTQSCGAYHPQYDTFHPDGHPNEVLCILATVYADHPDFDQRWRA